MKKYVLIAGVNGAGKSTLYRAIDSIQELPRINTDEIVKVFGRWDNKQDMFKALLPILTRQNLLVIILNFTMLASKMSILH